MKYIHQVLEASAKRYPNNIAIKHNNQVISYNNLNTQGDKLSLILKNIGLAKGSTVAIYMDNSIEAIIAIIGTLKAGYTYTPIDTHNPIGRIIYLLKESRSLLIVADRNNINKLDACMKEYLLPSIIIESSKNKNISFNYKYSTTSSPNIKIKKTMQTIKKNRAAYILFTSGSTGKCKGVRISHRASLFFIQWANSYFKITPKDRIPLISSLSFDMSIFEIFVTLNAGATIYIPQKNIIIFTHSFINFLKNNKITILYTVPTILINLINNELKNFAKIKTIRAILYAGEILNIKYANILNNTLKQSTIYNLFGPTETNVITCYKMKKDIIYSNNIPIGRPCKGLYYRISDINGKQVPTGSVGELLVGGAALMDGYIGDNNKNKNVFIKINSRIFYKTGDFVKENNQGILEFIGRTDNIIKINGYRINTLEIENILKKHPQIKDAIVIPVKNSSIKKYLYAFIIKNKYSGLNKKTINDYCSNFLPKYMLPEKYFFHKYFPITSTGKINKKAITSEQQKK